jgi:hypothetical protein
MMHLPLPNPVYGHLIPEAIDVVVRVVQAYSPPVRAHLRELVKS